MKKISVLLLLFWGFVAISFAQKLTKADKKLIEQVKNDKNATVLLGKANFVRHEGTKIWYEYIEGKDAHKGCILFVMGLGANGLVWSNPFIQPFLDAGYSVIRFDNRCVGNSDFMKNKGKTTFSLKNMAGDAFAILDTLGLKKIHLVGISMGGMISQEMCLEQPNRILSLTSIMSSGFVHDKTLPSPKLSIKSQMAWNIIRPKRGDKYEKAIRASIYIGKKLDAKRIDSLDRNWIIRSKIFDVNHQRVSHKFASLEQAKAIKLSGSRYEGLKKMTIPTLIIHGTADKLVPFEHGKKCASLIPNAKTLYLTDMGHNLTMKYRKQIISAILEHIK